MPAQPSNCARQQRLEPGLQRCRAASILATIIACVLFLQSGWVLAEGAKAAAAAGKDFIDEARVVYRIAACAGTGAVPPGIRTSVVDKHCKEFSQRLRDYGGKYATPMQAFIAQHRPAGLPSTVVYPFGGADLLSALIAYPDASEIYTLSLEYAGDIREVDQLGTVKAFQDLSAVREATAGLLGIDANHTLSINTNGELLALQEAGLRNPITLFLIALAAHHQEPIALRYFTFAEDGGIRYLFEEDFRRLEKIRAQALSENWDPPGFSAAYSNYELQFKPVGRPGPVRIHRHVAANLDNAHFNRDSGLFRHLEGKRRVAALIKGALNLLWHDDFSNIRDYLIESADFAISDCSGISPLHALPAGFAVTALGRYEGMLSLAAHQPHEQSLKALFARQPHRPLPARFGYADKRSNASMLIMRKERR